MGRLGLRWMEFARNRLRGADPAYLAAVRAVHVRLIQRGKSEGIVRPDVGGSALLDTVRGAVMLHTLVNP